MGLFVGKSMLKHLEKKKHGFSHFSHGFSHGSHGESPRRAFFARLRDTDLAHLLTEFDTGCPIYGINMVMTGGWSTWLCFSHIIW